MSEWNTPFIRPHFFLASALVGTIGTLLPVTAAHAGTTPTAPAGETLAMASTTAAPAAAGETPAIGGGAATNDQGGDTSIRPFKYHATDEQLADLRRRILATRWPTPEYVPDASEGVQLATIQKLAKRWADYDWRKAEARLDALPQFVTNIDGVDIHFIQVKSKEKNALPVIITHGWPGSIIEQLKIIDPLVNPTAHGGTAADAFDVVIPSLPGYGFSGKPTAPGWDPVRIARAFAVLMQRLGYSRFVAQGGDWGNAVTEQMALLKPAGLIGIHTNMPATVPPDIDAAALAGKPAPAGLGPDEKKAYDQLSFFYANGLGYAQEMSHRPQTLYALEDSPVGLAAWMIDHDRDSLDLITRSFDGKAEGLTPDDILDNITLYWLTATAVSSARLYHESTLPFFAPKGITLPVAVSAYPNELYQAPKSWTEKAYPKLIHYNRLPKGGHFAAWEQPNSFVEELRASFRSLRK
jgi:pimeloyl-ACP methyl ester carboxylesterase